MLEIPIQMLPHPSSEHISLAVRLISRLLLFHTFELSGITVLI